MPRNEPPYRYRDFPELFWDLVPDAEVDRENPRVIARLLEHADPETLWKLVPVDVLLRDFERLDLPEHTRLFWSVVVRMMREQRGMKAPGFSKEERGLTWRPRPRFHQRSGDPPPPIPDREIYRYGDLPELFWDLPRDEVVDGTNPVIIARLLQHGHEKVIWKIIPQDVLLREFENLDLPRNVRAYWAMVVESLGKRSISQSAA